MYLQTEYGLSEEQVAGKYSLLSLISLLLSIIISI